MMKHRVTNDQLLAIMEQIKPILLCSSAMGDSHKILCWLPYTDGYVVEFRDGKVEYSTLEEAITKYNDLSP